jgi:hypothetical protein
MRSTILLVKVVRWRLFGACLLAILIFGLAGWFLRSDDWPVHFMPFFFALLCTPLLYEALSPFSRLDPSFVPATARQRAWIPRFNVLLVWIVAAVAFALASAVHQEPGQESRFLSMKYLAAILPGALLALTFGPRLFRRHMGTLVSVWLCVMFLNAAHGATIPSVGIREHSGWWAFIALALSAFYFLEAPLFLALRDRTTTSTEYDGASAGKESRSPCLWRPHWMTALGDVGCRLFLLYFVVPPMISMLRTLLAAFPDSPSILQWIELVVLAGVVVVARRVPWYHCVSPVLASGFRGWQAVGLAALRATIVLSPLAEALGVKRGRRKRCRSCGGYRFTWVSSCPGCGSTPRASARKRKETWTEDPRERSTERLKAAGLAFAVLAVAVFWCCGSSDVSALLGHTESIHLAGVSNPEAQREAVLGVRAALEDLGEPQTWLADQNKLPERYRLEVSVSPSGVVEIRGFGPSWDPPTALVTGLARRIEEGLSATYRTTQKPTQTEHTEAKTRLPFTFLDNRVHWSSFSLEKEKEAKRNQL